ncbi:TonB-dependent receptor [bacterium]|nr:TonB-dependent receptor [bacterium]MBU3956091.1 TonB-dependent receptor [bacterium]
MKSKFLTGMCILALVQAASAMDEEKSYDLGKIVVTATKTELREAEIGASVTVITSEEIEEKGKMTVVELLRTVQGVNVTQQGGLGGFTQLYLRGGAPGHTMVMIDGIEVKYPMEMDGGFFDFAHLTTDNIERIEVIRGPQSTLYGSSAMSGVINIITKKGKGKPKFSVSSEGGSYKTFHKSVGLTGGAERGDYSFSVSRVDSDGISGAAGGSEKDGSRITTASSRMGLKMFGSTKLGLSLRYNDGESDIDDGANNDDPNYTAEKKMFCGGINFDQPVADWWEHKLHLSLVNTERAYRDLPDSDSPTEDKDSWYKGEIKKLDWQHNLLPSDFDTVTLGFDYKKEAGSTYYRSKTYISALDEKTFDNKGIYAQNHLNLGDRFFTTLGLRTDTHEIFGAETTYKLSSAYLIPQSGTRFKANWGTAFRAPSLYQLYSSYGDINLKPEESESYDMGIEQNLLDKKVFLSATYFHNDFTNMLGFDMATYKYKNIDKAETKGVEAEAKLIPIRNLTLKLSHTYLKAEDKNSNEPLTRRAKYKQNLNVNYAFLKKGNINLNLARVLKRHDKKGWPSTLIELEDYMKVDVSASYDLTRNFQIFGRLDNLFDKDYQEVYGYSALGISFSAGVKATF